MSILSARPRRGRTPSVPVVVATAQTMLVGQPQNGPWQPLRPTPRLRRFYVSCRVFLFLSCALALFRSFAQCRLRAPLVFFSCLRCELAAGVLSRYGRFCAPTVKTRVCPPPRQGRTRPPSPSSARLIPTKFPTRRVRRITSPTDNNSQMLAN